MTQPQIGRIMIDHRIHSPGRDAEKEARGPQLREVAQIIPPIGLRNNRHTITLGLQKASDNRRAKSRVIDISVTREKDDIKLVPTPGPHFLYGRR